MPLIIFLMFFAALFLLEIAWHYAGVAENERALMRYERSEHPRRLTSDRYIDALS